MEAKPEKTPIVAPVDVTDGGAACPAPWRILQVRSRSERRIAQQARLLGHETYVPAQVELHQWSDRRKRVERLLIPLVVFVRAHDDEVARMLQLPNVFGLMRAPGDRQPAIVPDSQIDQLRFMVGNSDAPVEFQPLQINPGDRVEVIRGKLRGLTGYALTLPDGHARLSVAIDLLGVATVTIDAASIKAI